MLFHFRNAMDERWRMLRFRNRYSFHWRLFPFACRPQLVYFTLWLRFFYLRYTNNFSSPIFRKGDSFQLYRFRLPFCSRNPYGWYFLSRHVLYRIPKSWILTFTSPTLEYTQVFQIFMTSTLSAWSIYQLISDKWCYLWPSTVIPNKTSIISTYRRVVTHLTVRP